MYRCFPMPLAYLFFVLGLSTAALPAAQPSDANPPLPASTCRPPDFGLLAVDGVQGRAVVRTQDGALRVLTRGQRLEADGLAVHQVTADSLILSRLDDLGNPTSRQVWLHTPDSHGLPAVRCLETTRTPDKASPWPLDGSLQRVPNASLGPDDKILSLPAEPLEPPADGL